jgi:hypothetical protein
MNQSQNGTITAYPLAWPVGWARTRSPQRARYDQDRTLAQARSEMINEVRLMGGHNLIISSNLELRMDGLPRSGQRQPADKGVAVYFNYKGKPVAFACDRWTTIEDNLWAVKLTVSAMRQIERSGVSELLERAFKGFDALPAPAGATWWSVLDVVENATADEIKTAFKALAKQHHPDMGGDPEQFMKVATAYEAAKKERHFS